MMEEEVVKEAKLRVEAKAKANAKVEVLLPLLLLHIRPNNQPTNQPTKQPTNQRSSIYNSPGSVWRHHDKVLEAGPTLHMASVLQHDPSTNIGWHAATAWHAFEYVLPSVPL